PCDPERAMRTEMEDSAGLQSALGAIRDELRRLGERVAALEALGGGQKSSEVIGGQKSEVRSQQRPLTSDLRPLTSEEGLSEELVLVISAAIAAFLGKKPHIRQIRLLGTTAWSQQGRVTIQASHALSARHTRSAT